MPLDCYAKWRDMSWLNPPAYGLYYICKVKKRGRLSPPLPLLHVPHYPESPDCLPLGHSVFPESVICVPVSSLLYNSLDCPHVYIINHFCVKFHFWSPKEQGISPLLGLLLNNPDVAFGDSVCYQFLNKLDCISVSPIPAEENRIILLPPYTELVLFIETGFTLLFSRDLCDIHCFRS